MRLGTLKAHGLYTLFFILSAGLLRPLAGEPLLPLRQDGFETAPQDDPSGCGAAGQTPVFAADSVRIEGMSAQDAIAILSRQGGDSLRPQEVKKLARLREKEEKRLARERKKQEKQDRIAYERSLPQTVADRWGDTLKPREVKKLVRELKKEYRQRREVEEYFSHITVDTARSNPVTDRTREADPLLDSLSIPDTDYYHRDDSTMVGEAMMLKKPPAPRPKSAAHAAFLSAIVPGLGQLYGGSQWWMAPVFWGGMTGTLIAVSYYNGYYNDFRKEYKNRIRTGEVHDYEYFDNATLVNRMQYAEQQRDLWIIGTVGIYLLNVLHANVSVQLSEFRIQRRHRKMLELQNLFERQTAPSAMRFSPAMIHPNEGVNHYPAPGIRLAIDF